ncbi:hypothetical protein E4V99_12300 [Microbacterium sp. dk485]|uniref:hypothetical protein n=1 Tax=Microbacterium sp. dk485 TaxID=2560021 RepID=UPI00107468AA|nr:hypothetical protein [Microbacterium sp. dk485]TFV81745.1 hypothetical protein E4V99_12300 [Microbacterium sp. dk485]
MSRWSTADVVTWQRIAGNEAIARNLQRGGPVPDATPGAPAPVLDAKEKDELVRHDVVLEGDDEARLAAVFPHGFSIAPRPDLLLSLSTPTRLDLVRVAALQVVAPAPLAAGAEAYLFKVAKGRCVLLSSIGGRSIMLDAGSGTSFSPTAPGVTRLLAAVGYVTGPGGVASAPSEIRVSHPDADHINAVRPLLATAGFSDTAVRVAAEQLQAGGRFSRANLTVQTTQRLITVDVTGGGTQTGGVHVSRTILDNLEITEFRSVAPHTAARSSVGQTFNRNRTSPVTVVTDLVTGERSVYTADAAGRQFTEIVNAVGEVAFRRLLGADARNLRLMELPHHGGKQTGPDAAGILRMLQLAFESGNGSTRLITQTSASFAAAPASSIGFLDVAGVPTERVTTGPSAQGSAEVVRARGAQLHTVTMDTSGVRQVLEIAGTHGNVLSQAYAKLAEIAQLRADAGSIAQTLAATAAPGALVASTNRTHKDLMDQETRLRAVADTVWDSMRAGASGKAGMRGSRDVSGVNRDMGNLASATATTILSTARGDLETHVRSMSAYSRVFLNVVKMAMALDAGRFQDVHAIRAEQLQLLRAARAVLGNRVFAEHVRAAWDVTRQSWTTDRIQNLSEQLSRRVVSRRMSTEFRMTLGITAARQLRLNEIAESSLGGRQVYGPGGRITTPAFTRVGAGILAAIEVVRLGLDIAEQAQAAAEAKEFEQIRQSHEGIAMVNWWMRHGVMPDLALVDRGSWSGEFSIVSGSLSQETIRAVVRSDTPPAGTPSFDKIVVHRIDPGELTRMVASLAITVRDLQAWNELNAAMPHGPAFKRFDEGWAVKVWSDADKDYRYHLSPILTPQLDSLMSHLEAAQDDRLQVEIAAGQPGSVRTVKDSAIFGTDRDMYVYGRGGAFTQLDSEDFPPVVTVLSHHSFAPRSGGGKWALVKAADLRTYRFLSSWWWVKDTGREYMDRHGTHRELSISANAEGYAYVDPDDLITSETASGVERAARGANPGISPAL